MSRRRPTIVLVGAVPDIKPLQIAVRDHEDYFSHQTWRQDTPGTAHAHTQTIYLRMPREINLHTVFHSLDAQDTALMDEPQFSGAVAALARMIGKKPARAMIVRLAPQRAIAAHIDEGIYARATERYHLTITSNPGAQLTVDDTVCVPREGEVHFFDKSQRHYAVNWGSTPRDHLILDVFK